MPKICIPPNLIEKIKGHNLDVSTEERTKIFRQYFDEQTSRDLSKQFERTKLLKNQETAMNKFIDGVSETGQLKKADLKKKLAKELQRKRELMYDAEGNINPNFEALAGRTDDEMNNFVQDTIKRKYDLGITPEQAKVIWEAKNTIKQAEKLGFNAEGQNTALGLAKQKYSQILTDIVHPEEKMGLGSTIKYNASKVGQDIRAAEGGIDKTKVVAKAITNIAFSNALKSVKAAADLSGLGKQGKKMLLDDPKLYWSTVKKSLGALKGEGKLDAFHAMQMGDKMFDDATEAGVRLITKEDYFLSTLFQKIKGGPGAILKKSDDSFTILTQNFRFEKYKNLVNEWKTAFPDWNVPGAKRELTLQARKELASHANSISGSGSFGQFEKYVPALNLGFFSPRFIKSQLDTVIHMLSSNPIVRKNASKLGAKYAAFSATTMAGAAMMGQDVEWNPLSTKFGKVRYRDTDKWIPIDDGLFAYVTKVAVLGQALLGMEPTVKNAKTDKISKINTGKYGERTAFQQGVDFVTNKLTPQLSFLVTRLRGEDYEGNKPTLGKEAINLIAPIGGANAVKLLLSDEEALDKAILIGLEFLGQSSNEYGSK